MPAPKKADDAEVQAAPAAEVVAAVEVPVAPAAPALPGKVRLTHGHGFVDDNKRVRHWKAGEVVSDPSEVALLVSRKAPFVVV